MDKDYTVEMWIEYIHSHEEEFEVCNYGLNKYGSYTVTVAVKKNRHYTESGCGRTEEKAREDAFRRLASVLYQWCKTPSNIEDNIIWNS